MAGVIAILLVKSAVFVLLFSVKGILIAAAIVVAFVLLRGPKDT